MQTDLNVWKLQLQLYIFASRLFIVSTNSERSAWA